MTSVAMGADGTAIAIGTATAADRGIAIATGIVEEIGGVGTRAATGRLSLLRTEALTRSRYRLRPVSRSNG
jgi:hypothetical protein